MNDGTVNESVALVKVEPVRPADVIARGVEQATPLAEIIKSKKLSVRISGRDYVKVEGWVVLAAMNSVLPREIEVERIEDGTYIATVALIRMSDGTELTRASAECGMDEPLWAQRPNYARRSMAITRATGKACRIAFSWVLVLAGYEPTPFEEMDGVHVQGPPRNETVDADEVEDEDGPFSTTPPAPKPSNGPVIPFGKNKGKPLTELTVASLTWYRDKMIENRQEKGTLSRIDEIMLQDLEAELSRRPNRAAAEKVPF
jgi:hypothetical protein